MYFCKEKKLCIFEPPKTGTRTMQAFLKAAGWNFLPPYHGFPEDCLQRYPNLYGYKAYCFIRNPLDRFVSTVLFLKQNGAYERQLLQMLMDHGIDRNVETSTYEDFVDCFKHLRLAYTQFFTYQLRWTTHPNTELLDFDNFESELRRISGDYSTEMVKHHVSTDFGRSVITQKVIDFVRQEYAADYALAKDRLGKEY